MELKDIQKKELDIVITARVSEEDKKFIEKKNINVGLLIRNSLAKLREDIKK